LGKRGIKIKAARQHRLRNHFNSTAQTIIILHGFSRKKAASIGPHAEFARIPKGFRRECAEKPQSTDREIM
jgi:hypothetical protein